MIPFKLQITLIAAVLVLFVFICYCLKNKTLSLKYTLIWFAADLMMGIMAIFPEFLNIINSFFGIQSLMNGLFIWAIAFIVLIILSLTSIVSRHNKKIQTLVQYNSRLEERIRNLETVIEHSADLQ